MIFESIGLTTPIDPINISFISFVGLAKAASVQEPTNPMG
jgi:hypothetical protein